MVANSLFITGTVTTRIWIKELEAGKRKGPRANGEATKIVLRQHANCPDLTKSDAKEGKVVLRQHANCLDLPKSDAKEGKVELRQNANCLDLTKSDAKEGIKVVLEQHAYRQG